MKRENKEKDRVMLAIILACFAILLSISMISALNAKIGNGKVVLYVKVGDVVEKSIKVINDNNNSVNIELIADGDLKDQFKFKKANFTLQPHEETDAFYSLKVTKEGKTTSYVNVKFTSVGEKNGIILPASVIIFAQRGNGTIIDDNSGFNLPDNTDSNGDSVNKKNPALTIGLVITAAVFVILLLSLYIYSRNKNNSFNKSAMKKEFSIYPTPNDNKKDREIGYKGNNINQKKKEKL